MIMVQALLVAGVPAAEIRSYPLDDQSVYTVRVSLHEPTTCVFPGPLKAVVGANVSTRADENPGVLLSHEPGSEYFSLRALKEGATGALNLVYRGKVYALAFVTARQPDRAVVFLDDPVAGKGSRAAPLDLPALLERAKQHERQPVAGMTSTVASAAPRTVTAYRAFSATIETIVRFEAEDVLVFRVRLDNALATSVPYDPAGLAVQLGRDFYPAALTDASGAIPPGGSSIIHLVISGAPTGGRANLSVREPFSVIVPHS